MSSTMTTEIINKRTLRLSKPDIKKGEKELIKESWKIIAPWWPLKNLIAVNPLQGFEELPIEEALSKSAAYFEQPSIPESMERVNRETIKWLKGYFDEGQATIVMPQRDLGLYNSWKQLCPYDYHLHKKDPNKVQFLKSLSNTSETALSDCLSLMQIPIEEREDFFKLLLSTMPGWASYIKYKADWETASSKETTNEHIQTDYLAMRAIITYLMWPDPKDLLLWHEQAKKNLPSQDIRLNKIKELESEYRIPLLKKLASQSLPISRSPSAQLVFCIDVRSEPFRKELEDSGNYETFGFAGFFGIPAQITDTVTGESYASCPVLLNPKHTVKQSLWQEKLVHEQDKRNYVRFSAIKSIYQSMKYTFIAPFAMVEYMGIFSGGWTLLRTFAPTLATKIKTSLHRAIRQPLPFIPSIDEINLADQCTYAEAALRMIGLTADFAPLVVFCGHGSCTENNAYATSLDCGACGGRHGGKNGHILAKILNESKVREILKAKGISIPDKTVFIGAEHNTTTDEVTLQDEIYSNTYIQLKQDLIKARSKNNATRQIKIEGTKNRGGATDALKKRSQDWAQVRPEWGLARNAAFIIAPRSLTRSLDLEGRCFLHSYDHIQDIDGKFLETILTAPMVVAQWINAQYLFSTENNAIYGGGSKVTKNIVGKFGIMQGNASDLMTGLPLQSVHSSDKTSYHEPQRLMTVVRPLRKVSRPF